MLSLRFLSFFDLARIPQILVCFSHFHVGKELACIPPYRIFCNFQLIPGNCEKEAILLAVKLEPRYAINPKTLKLPLNLTTNLHKIIISSSVLVLFSHCFPWSSYLATRSLGGRPGIFNGLLRV